MDNLPLIRFKDLFNVSRETIAKLKSYELLLKQWNPKINLVARSTLDDIWTRHFIDSAQLWAKHAKTSGKWLDIGAGGGFPGLIVAILASEHQSDQTTTLVESDQRKAAFLRKVCIDLNLNAEILASRSEELPPQSADVLSARAFAPLWKLMSHAQRHLRSDGFCLLLKGENADIELTEAQKYWTYKYEKSPSVSSEGGVIIKIWEIRGV